MFVQRVFYQTLSAVPGRPWNFDEIHRSLRVGPLDSVCEKKQTYHNSFPLPLDHSRDVSFLFPKNSGPRRPFISLLCCPHEK